MTYFKHMSNMRNDTKIRRVISRYGIEGYGLYCLILESIVEKITTDSPLPTLEDTCEDLAAFYRADTAKVNEIVRFMINQGLLEHQEMENLVTCSKIYKYLEQSATGSKHLRTLIANYKDSAIMQHHDGIMTNSEGISENLNRIEKNRIEKNRIEYNTPLPPFEGGEPENTETVYTDVAKARRASKATQEAQASPLKTLVEGWQSYARSGHGLVEDRRLMVNVPELREAAASAACYTPEEVTEALANYADIIKNRAQYRTVWPEYTTPYSFAMKGIPNYLTAADPWKRCQPLQADPGKTSQEALLARAFELAGGL
jgi:hypothetical protein